jgi:hypothetical protein
VLIAALAALSLFAQDEPEVWARLPEPVTNNAVAGAEVDGRMMAYSFAGLHEGKTWRDVTADAYACDLEARTCREMAGLPDGIGRLASVAVNVGGQIYIFGGYTVAEDGSEASTPEVWRFDPESETYTHITDMPVPVDDTVALPFQDRYIYLVSGWHDTDNIDLVQVYDVEEDRWFEATPFPGAPVFGHAGAIGWPFGPDTELLICGGTIVVPPNSEGERRSFVATDSCWSGRIGTEPGEIDWQSVGPLPGGAFYRGTGLSLGIGRFAFIGGTMNSFNFNGIGYDGNPSSARADVVIVDVLRSDVCRSSRVDVGSLMVAADAGRRELPVMDIRGIVRGGPDIYVLGGMRANQSVSDWVVAVPIYPTDDAIQITACDSNLGRH